MATTHTAPPPPTGQPLGASLRRSSTDRLILGLCSGLARSLDVSVTTVRVATLLIGIVLLPATVLAYLVTAAILPADDGSALVGVGERNRRDVTAALLLTFLGAPLVIGAGADWGLTSGPLFWPLFGVGLAGAAGVWLFRRQGAASPAATSEAPPRTGDAVAEEPTAGTGTAQAYAASEAVTIAATSSEPGATATDDDAPTLVKQADVPAPSAEPESSAATEPESGHETSSRGEPVPLVGPAPTSDAGSARPTFFKRGQVPPSGPAGPAKVAPEPEPRRRGLAMPVIAVMALVPAVTAILYAIGVVDGDWSTWAVMLAVLALTAAGGAVAIALLRPSYLGAALLVVLAAVLGTSSIAISQAGPYVDDGVGQRVFRPETPAQVRPLYVHGIGVLNLDLRDLKLSRNSRTVIRAEIGFGEVNVAIPRGVRVVPASGSTLDLVAISARDNGASDAESDSAPTIVLDAAARVGEVRLVSGQSANFDSLEVLATQTTGFWDPNGTERFDRFRDQPQGAVTP